MTYSDFDLTAQSLDIRRLGKQRVEAYQVLIILQDVQIVSQLLNIPQGSLGFKEWVNVLRREDKKQPFRIVRNLVTNDIYKISRSDPVYRLKDSDKQVIYNKDNIIIQRAKSQQILPLGTQVLTRDEHPINFGFASHSLVVMWHQHLDALCAYINAMVTEWIRRGYHNNMVTYVVPNDYQKPSWVENNDLLINHRAALFHKEQVNLEQPWYVHQPDFVTAGPFVEYIWYDYIDNEFVPIAGKGHSNIKDRSKNKSKLGIQ